MTTDTFPKAAARETAIGGKPVTIAGIAKGSGMIAPDMATMLSFVFTDAPLPSELLQSLLRQGTDQSFNCIPVAGATPTRQYRKRVVSATTVSLPVALFCRRIFTSNFYPLSLFFSISLILFSTFLF